MLDFFWKQAVKLAGFQEDPSPGLHRIVTKAWVYTAGVLLNYFRKTTKSKKFVSSSHLRLFFTLQQIYPFSWWERKDIFALWRREL